jgi:hypothetical protein
MNLATLYSKNYWQNIARMIKNSRLNFFYNNIACRHTKEITGYRREQFSENVSPLTRIV